MITQRSLSSSLLRTGVLHTASMLAICGCTATVYAAKTVMIGGEPVLTLYRQRSPGSTGAEFLSVVLLPGRGMNVLQITAYLPGMGEIPLLASPPPEEAAKLMDRTGPDVDGNQSFLMGGAILFPFANRILGPTSEDGRFVKARWHDRSITLPVNWRGRRPNSPPQALHGYLLASRAAHVQQIQFADGAAAEATYVLPANGHWFSDNTAVIRVELHATTLTITVNATNTGKQEEPVGIGWHPYFRIPSGDRAAARLHLPAHTRAAVNNPDDMFPTGELLPVQGTTFDFTAPEGAPLTGSINDAFLSLDHDAAGHIISCITDEKANYGLEVAALSPYVQTVLVYAPADQPLIVLEPQFNNGDPFGAAWKGKDNGMVTLAPGASVEWKTRLRLFSPQPARYTSH